MLLTTTLTTMITRTSTRIIGAGPAAVIHSGGNDLGGAHSGGNDAGGAPNLAK